MRGFPRLIALLGAGALSVGTVAACGDEPSGSQLEPASMPGDEIWVTPDSNVARQLEGPSTIDLTLGEGVTVPATTGTLAWTRDAADQLDADDVRALALALGADGTVDRDAAGAWSVGASPDSAAGLLAGGYLGDSFTYMSTTRWEQFVSNPCDPTSTCPGPTGVPDRPVALAAAQRLVDALGINRDDVDVATDVREDGMRVRVRSLVDGLPALVPMTTGPGPGEPPSAPGGVRAPADSRSVVDTVTGFGVGHEVLWDVGGRCWIVPTFTISTARNMLFTVFAIEGDMVRVVDAPVGDRDRDNGGAGPELAPPIIAVPAMPAPSIAGPTTGVPTAPFVPAPTVPLMPPAPGTTAVVPCGAATSPGFTERRGRHHEIHR